MSKPKTQEQLDRETDRRLQRTYGKSLFWFKAQPQFCRICGDQGKTRRLNVDHDHKYKLVKIRVIKAGELWGAHAVYRNRVYFTSSAKLSGATARLKEILKSDSVRGLLCHRCNRAMILLRDRPDLLRKAADYLEEHQGVMKEAA